MTLRVRLTPRAISDMRQIGRYTERRWGREQRDIYLRALDQRFATLADNPLLGRARPEIAAGYRSLPHGSHLIFYMIGNDTIDIIGVPHQSMDLPSVFPGEDSAPTA